MIDIKLLEVCEHCGKNIVLMVSINVETRKTMLVKRCLNCGQYRLEEVVEIEGEK